MRHPIRPENNSVIAMPDGSFIPAPKSSKSKSSDRAKYKALVRKLTNANSAEVEGIETRSWRESHIDHKISIDYGFRNNIPPEHIADPSNLRMLSKKENFDKGTTIFVDNLNSWIV